MALVFPNTIQYVKNFDRRITTTQTSVINTFVSLFFEKIRILMKISLRQRYFYTATANFPAVIVKASARTLMGRGVYSHILPDYSHSSARLVSFVIKLISKEISRA